jgi:1-acyl-sn-glycerol-3-phosphate acyltransferase
MGRKFYRLVHTVFKPVFGVCYLKKATGLENLPEDGAFVLCANHLSALDPICISARLPGKLDLAFLAKKELFQNKFLKILIDALGAIPVDRGSADIAAIRASMQALKDGKCLLIFPQGTRSKDNTPTPMLSGASMIALRGGVPVIPCYIDGPYKLFRPIEIRFGKPIDFSDFGRKCDAATLEEATRRIEAAIWGMKDA